MTQKISVAIQCNEYGARGGIGTYTDRLNYYLNKQKDVESKVFVNKLRKNSVDIINVQYEPGMLQPQQLQWFTQKYSQPIVVTVHHMGVLQQFYGALDGYILHSENQIPTMKGNDGSIVKDEPWPSYQIIPHPALVFKDKNKNTLRKKFGLPTDKKILGTAGFIAGTGKALPQILDLMLSKLNDDEFLYCTTSFWKGGDFGFEEQIKNTVKKYGKENNFRIDSDFVDDETFNERLQCCDLLFAWNKFEHPGSNSGVGMDMIGSRRKLIVKDSPHYGFVGGINGVEKGRPDMNDFVDDVFKLFRGDDLDKNIPDPTPYSWETLSKEYVNYFREILNI